MEMRGPLRVKSLLRLVPSTKLVKFFQTFSVDTRWLLVQTMDMVVVDFFETVATGNCPSQHSSDTERMVGEACVSADGSSARTVLGRRRPRSPDA